MGDSLKKPEGETGYKEQAAVSNIAIFIADSSHIPSIVSFWNT